MIQCQAGLWRRLTDGAPAGTVPPNQLSAIAHAAGCRAAACRRETPEINFFFLSPPINPAAGRLVGVSEDPAGWISPCYATQPLRGIIERGFCFCCAVGRRGRRRPRNVARLLSENRPSSLERLPRSMEWIEKCRIFQFGQPHISAVRRRRRGGGRESNTYICVVCATTSSRQSFCGRLLEAEESRYSLEATVKHCGEGLE